MPTLRKFWIVVLPVAMLGGCRKSAPSQDHEALVKEAIASARTTASSLNGVMDAASAEQTIKVLQREAENLKSLRQKLAGLGGASDPARRRAKKHSQDIIAASEQMVQASGAVVGKIQAGKFPPDLAKRLATASADYGQAMADFWQQAASLLE